MEGVDGNKRYILIEVSGVLVAFNIIKDNTGSEESKNSVGQHYS